MTDKDGRNPLFYAFQNNHVAILRELMRQGGKLDIDPKYTEGLTEPAENDKEGLESLDETNKLQEKKSISVGDETNKITTKVSEFNHRSFATNKKVISASKVKTQLNKKPSSFVKSELSQKTDKFFQTKKTATGDLCFGVYRQQSFGK